MSRSQDGPDKSALFVVPGYFGRLLEPEDGDALQALLGRCADYFELTCGLPPGPAEAQSMFMVLPEGKDYDDKFLVGVFNDSGELVGALDAVRDYPHPTEWSLGLMLLDPCERGRGLGEGLYRAFERWVTDQGGRSIRLGVVEQNERAHRFWHRVGFETIERKPPQKFGGRESVVIVMRRALRENS